MKYGRPEAPLGLGEQLRVDVTRTHDRVRVAFGHDGTSASIEGVQPRTRWWRCRPRPGDRSQRCARLGDGLTSDVGTVIARKKPAHGRVAR